jgi:adenylate cyclase
MRFKLTSADNLQTYELRSGAKMLVGRAPTSDIPVFDPTISRRHAELVSDDKTVQVRDLGSSNGTFINGARVESGTIGVGDTVTFGKVAFKLNPAASASMPTEGMVPDSERPIGGATILRQQPVKVTPGSFAAVAAISGETAREDGKTLEEQKLEILLEVSKGLGGADTDAILSKITDYAYQILNIDRVAIQLRDERGTLITKIARDKKGTEQTRAVPQSIARTAVQDKVAMITNDAGADQRFGGQSIVLQQIRSAICSPLIGREDRVLGVIYVDNVSSSHQFNEADLDFVVAFSGIAAAAIENSQLIEQRSNFKRYFAPHVAERIASSVGATRLGGEKRTVVVLFSDIRGFTTLAENMQADDMASLLTEYFTEMVECVFDHEGTLDKFVGDSVMAQWGAPIQSEKDADKAIAAAVDMMKRLDKLNEKWKAEGRPTLDHGIGINTGEAFAGNIGSERRLEFTVIGDTVNTASRICSAAGPGDILISEDMKKAISRKTKLKEIPPLELKNKSQPVKVYKVLI